MSLFNVFPEQYPQQLADKVDKLQQQLNAGLLTPDSNCLSPITIPAIEIFDSPTSHYRMRAEFKVWHEDQHSYYAMSDKETKKPVFLESFPVAAKKINHLMPLIMAEINQHELLRKKLFQIEFLTTLTEDTLITFIYHRPITEEWIALIRPLKEKLGITIIGRSRKQKVLLDRDFVNEALQVNDRTYYYRQNEGSFTQPNAKVCEKMLSWAVNKSKKSQGDLLELYCGNGNFTLPLAQNFNRVIATEISKSSVNAAQHNIAKNHISNVAIIRMSSEDFAEAMDKIRPFRRLADIDLDSYDFSTVLVDPPRAGLDEHTIAIIQRFEQIIYISCNPTTLVENLKSLCKTHQITALAAFDQFPYTDHLEAGVVLQKIKPE
jgi:tRNA (uracil-5-)-methyltransferase